MSLYMRTEQQPKATGFVHKVVRKKHDFSITATAGKGRGNKTKSVGACLSHSCVLHFIAYILGVSRHPECIEMSDRCQSEGGRLWSEWTKDAAEDGDEYRRRPEKLRVDCRSVALFI